MRLARDVRATFILDVMDLWPETFARLLPNAFAVRRLLTPVFFGGMAMRRKAIVAAAAGISGPCRAYVDVVTKKTLSSAARHICYHGCEIEPIHGVAESGVSLTKMLECIYAGSLEASQDLEILPSVVQQLSHRGVAATIHIAGTGSREATLHRAADRLKGSCQLRVHGLLDRPAYKELLTRCQLGLVCVKPNSMVAMPYKAGDYAAAGLAIVNSLPGELAQMLDQYKAGVSYTAENPTSLANAIASLAKDPQVLAKMRQAARRMAEEEFDRRKTYVAFADWVETVHAGR